MADVDEENVTQSNQAGISYHMSDGTERSLFYAGEEIIVVGTPIDTAYEAGDEVVTLRWIKSTDGGEITNSRSEDTLEIEDDFDELAADQTEIETPSGDSPQAFVRIEDDSLDAGDYFIRDTERRIAETEANSIETAVQRFDAAWAEETVEIGAEETAFELEVDSQRSTYNINVSAEGLEYDDLEALFLDEHVESEDRLETNAPRINRAPFEDAAGNRLRGGTLDDRLQKASAYEDDDVIVLRGTNDGRLAANISNADLDPGTLEFDLEVTDSGVSTTAPLTLEDPDADAEFDRAVYNRAAGDILDVSVSLEDTDDTYLVFGDRESDYLDIVYLEDDTDDGSVEFTINTRLVGTQPHPAVAGGDDAFTSSEDTVISLAAADNQATPNAADDVFEGLRLEAEDDVLATTGNAVPGAAGSLNALRDELDLRPIVRPLQPATYEMRLTTDGVVGLQNSGDLRVDGEHDLALVELTEPQLNATMTHSAPTNASNAVERETLRNEMTTRETVAIGDRLIFEIDATGYLGHVIAAEIEDDTLARYVFENGTTTRGLHKINADETDGITFVFESETAAANQEPNRLVFDTAATDNLKLFVDPETQTVLVVVDTRAHPDIFDRQIADGDLFTLHMAYTTASDERYRFAETVTRGDFEAFAPFAGSAGGLGEYGSYPYLFPGNGMELNTSVVFERPAIELDRVTPGHDRVRLGLRSDTSLSGMTNLAAGSNIEVRVFSDGEPPIADVTETTVQDDGRFDVEVDTSSGESGQAVRIELRNDGKTIDEYRGILVDDRTDVSITDRQESEPIESLDIDAFVPEGGFVAIYDEFPDDSPSDGFRGASPFLTEGAHFNVEVELEAPFDSNTTAVAVLHQDTNDNRDFDFIDSMGTTDEPYLTLDGDPVTDTATMAVIEPTTTPTETPSSTPTETRSSPRPQPATPTPVPDDQTWPSGMAMILAIGVALLLAARRNQ